MSGQTSLKSILGTVALVIVAGVLGYSIITSTNWFKLKEIRKLELVTEADEKKLDELPKSIRSRTIGSIGNMLSEDSAQRVRSAVEVKFLGIAVDRALQVLIEGTEHGEPDIRAEAIRGLKGEYSAEVIEIFRQHILEDTSSDVRVAAIEALGSTFTLAPKGTEEKPDPGLSGEDDPRTWRDIDPASVFAALDDPDTEVRKHAGYWATAIKATIASPYQEERDPIDGNSVRVEELKKWWKNEGGKLLTQPTGASHG